MQLHNFCKIIATFVKNKRNFFIFLVQQKLALIISDAVTSPSNDLFSIYFLGKQVRIEAHNIHVSS